MEKSEVGIVLIGRNEGDRLKECVTSLPLNSTRVVYVDSGSSDDSVDFCRSKGVHVVELDMSIPFTAARARNSGFQYLTKSYSSIEYIQFIDGDCQLESGWLEKALDFLRANPDVVAVCGRRKEIKPEQSIYNLLCDIEWDTPVGEAMACGGDVLMRSGPLKDLSGYRDDLIAGEEPELCFRMRQKGWRIYRLDEAMTLHDANISNFNQWWKRSRRAGYAYMKGALLHGHSTERYNVRPVLRAFFWAIIYPFLVAILSTLYGPAYLLLLSAYLFQWIRVARSGSKSLIINLKWAYFIVIGKFAESSGMLHCLADSVSSRKAELIEYK